MNLQLSSVSPVIADCRFDAHSSGCYHSYAGWSSLVARWAHNPKVAGSNPAPATKTLVWFQLVEPAPRMGSVTLHPNSQPIFPNLFTHCLGSNDRFRAAPRCFE